MTGKKKEKTSRGNRQKFGKVYHDSDDEDEKIHYRFDVLEKVKSPMFPRYFVKEMRGDEVTVEWCQRTGFNLPIFVKEKSGLHMTVPDPTFSVTDVKNMVGGKRMVEVMDCSTQHNMEMTMKDWEEFYTDSDRDEARKLNVISLEFSNTKLDTYVICPRTVRQVL